MDETVVDACCLINLCAAGELQRRLAVIGGDWYVPTAVVSETLYLHVEQDDGTLTKTAVDLQAFVDQGILLPCAPDPGEELDLYVDLATQLDDGEAMALAIAKTRNWVLSTDDRKVKRLAVTIGVRVVTTPELMKRWADNTGPDESELSDVLKRIERCASFFPGASDALRDWWRGSILD